MTGDIGARPSGPRPRGLPHAPRCLVMGVVNVTPDSFSDGGNWAEAESAIARGRDLSRAGADIVDVGGESTRPGARRIPAAEELRRVIPVVTELARAGVWVSVDTMRAQVAERALAAGARMVNDVSGGLADPDMVAVVAASGVPYVVTHWRGHSADMYRQAVYEDVVSDVRAELSRRVTAVLAAGVDPAQIIVDPGLGFAKVAEHNWALLASLREISGLDATGSPFPLLVAASRKRFIGRLLAAPDGEPRSFTGSDDATIALTALAAGAGAWCVRVHEVPGNADAVRVAERWREATVAAAGRAGLEDRISLHGLRAFGRHGVLEHERVDGQEFVIDAGLVVDTRAAAAADDLTLTADYGVLADRLAEIVAGPPVALIETLAQRLAVACLDNQAVREVEITVHKPHAPVAQPVADITVTIRRGRA
jgi:dihydropteroate synthase